MRTYIPLFARLTHLDYDEDKAKKWMQEHPGVRSPMLGNMGKPISLKLKPAIDSICPVVEDDGEHLTPAQVRLVIPDWQELGATLPQARFAAEYCSNNFNAVKAYKNAVNSTGSYATMSTMASKYMQIPSVVKCIEAFTVSWIGEKRLQLHSKILQILWAQAFYDPSMFINGEGQPTFTDLTEIPSDMRCVVVSIKTKYHGKDATQKTIEIELVDRKSAIRELAAYVNLMKDAKTTPTITINADAEAMFTAVFATAMNNTKNLKTVPSFKEIEAVEE